MWPLTGVTYESAALCTPGRAATACRARSNTAMRCAGSIGARSAPEDPNRPDDPEYIVRLVGQVVRVSVETVKIVDSLPAEYA